MTDRTIATGIPLSAGARRKSFISRRAALAFWIIASVAVWIGIVEVAIAVF